MTRVLQTRQVGLTTHASGHVMAPPDIVYEVKGEPKRKAPLIPFLFMVVVRSAFAATPIALAITWMVQAGWLPS